jgi:hypothetical protein
MPSRVTRSTWPDERGQYPKMLRTCVLGDATGGSTLVSTRPRHSLLKSESFAVDGSPQTSQA